MTLTLLKKKALKGTQLAQQTQIVNKIFKLNNGKVDIFPTYFIISGEIDDKYNDFKSYGTSPLYAKAVGSSTTQNLL